MTETAAVLGALPERIELDDGVVIRTYTAEDIPHLVDVVNDNLDHLRPWMPWAQEPVTIEAQTAWWRGRRNLSTASTWTPSAHSPATGSSGSRTT